MSISLLIFQVLEPCDQARKLTRVYSEEHPIENLENATSSIYCQHSTHIEQIPLEDCPLAVEFEQPGIAHNLKAEVPKRLAASYGEFTSNQSLTFVEENASSSSLAVLYSIREIVIICQIY